MRPHAFNPGPLFMAMALAASAPAAGADVPAGLAHALAELQTRLARLEAHNAELERRLAAAQESPALEPRVQQLERARDQLESALASERLSQEDPEVANRLKAVEFQAQGLQRQARTLEALEGIAAGVAFTSVAQRANAGATLSGHAESQLAWRGDAQISLPGGHAGLLQGDLFFHFRMGQGEGLGDLRPGFAATNAAAFQLGGSGQADDASPILAQAWYQLQVPLDDRPPDDSRHHLEITFGKIDPFLFFDQNAVADDETTRHLNLAFVHNPLLDAGGGAGLDAYGFTPGIRVAYQDRQSGPNGWGASVGVFGSGPGSAFDGSLRRPFAIAQLETRQQLFGGMEGNFRAYAWHNGRATAHDGVTLERQRGWGVSLDQRLGEGITAWGRYGHGTSGSPAFDRALTVGLDFAGSAWNRNDDGVGVALGWLAAADTYRAAHPDVSGAEQLAELYYRWRVLPQFELTPDYQFIRRTGADRTAADAHVVGLRAQLVF